MKYERLGENVGFEENYTSLDIFNGWIGSTMIVRGIISLHAVRQSDCKNFNFLLHKTTFNYLSDHPVVLYRLSVSMSSLERLGLTQISVIHFSLKIK